MFEKIMILMWYLCCVFAVPELNDIQDAYVVAVEDEAKKRLEQLSALHKVKAIDISKVHDFGNNLDNDSLNGNIETNPIYITTSKLSQQVDTTDNHDTDSNSNPNLGDNSPELHRSNSSSSIESDLTNDKMDTAMMRNGYINGHSNGPVIHDGYTANGLKDTNMASTQFGKQYGLHHSEDHIYQSVDDDSGFDGPHREMAIDVPANFIGAKKEKPRYPHPNGGPHPLSKSQPTTPIKRPFGGSDGNLTKPPDMTQAEKLEHMEKIKKYQDELRKKRDEEDRLASEEEFLRTSLRGSKKLQALEEARAQQYARQLAPSGIINPNFEEDTLAFAEEDITQAATLPVRSHKPDSTISRPIGKSIFLQTSAKVK